MKTTEKKLTRKPNKQTQRTALKWGLFFVWSNLHQQSNQYSSSAAHNLNHKIDPFFVECVDLTLNSQRPT
jgi:hypothetical protein